MSALQFLLVVEALGLAALPLTRVLFGRLPGAGAGLAKPLAVLLVTWGRNATPARRGRASAQRAGATRFGARCGQRSIIASASASGCGSVPGQHRLHRQDEKPGEQS